MVNRLVSTFGVLAVFALLVGFGGATPEAKMRIPAKAISEIPITHHFSAVVPQVGALGGSPSAVSGTMPPSAGIAICQLAVHNASFSNAIVIVTIDGADVWKATMGGGNNSPTEMTIVPPLIVPAGSALQIRTDNSGSHADLTVSGYTLEPGYFGM